MPPPSGAAGLPLAEGLNGVVPVFANAHAHAQWVAMNGGNALPNPPQANNWGNLWGEDGPIEADSDGSDFEDEMDEVLGNLVGPGGNEVVGPAGGNEVVGAGGGVGVPVGGGVQHVVDVVHDDEEEDDDDGDESDEEMTGFVRRGVLSGQEMMAVRSQIAEMLRDRSRYHKHSRNKYEPRDSLSHPRRGVFFFGLGGH
jgi:hypothetical protein